MSVQLTYPGVYVEELPSGVHTITGVATSIAAFIGWAPKGPVDHAVLVESWPEFQSTFGGLYPGVYLGYAVSQFFANGGTQAYIVRLAWDGLPTVTNPAPIAASTAHVSNVGGSMTLYASNPGAWANDLQVRLIPKSGDNTRFSLQVINAMTGNVLESFDNLSVSASDPKYMVTVVDSDSQNVTFVDPAHPTTAITPPNSISATTLPPPTNPQAASQPGGELVPSTWYYYKITAIFAAGESAETSEVKAQTSSTNNLSVHVSWTAPASFNGKSPTGYRILRGTTAGAEDSYFTVPGSATTFDDDGTLAPSLGSAQPTANAALQLTGGLDGSVLEPDTSDFENALLNDPSGRGLPLLDRVPIFNLLCVPGETTTPTVQDLQAYAAARRAFCIIDSAETATYETLQAAGPAGLTTAPNAANSALYFPWVSAPDPLAGNRPTPMPPCGFVAGIYAATDASRGVWKAPAGINAGLTGALALQHTLTDLENGDLNIQGINCLREFRVFGDVVWGARTLVGANEVGSQWKYVPIRRLALYLESSLYEGTAWVVFEENDERLWSQIRLNVGAFMQGLFLQGAFQGTTPQKAYLVKCDAENNPQSSIGQGVVNILVGFAPLYPAEFVVIQIQQLMASQS